MLCFITMHPEHFFYNLTIFMSEFSFVVSCLLQHHLILPLIFVQVRVCSTPVLYFSFGLFDFEHFLLSLHVILKVLHSIVIVRVFQRQVNNKVIYSKLLCIEYHMKYRQYYEYMLFTN